MLILCVFRLILCVLVLPICFFYGIPEAPDVSKNLPGPCSSVFPKYEPIPSHGDPIHAQNYNNDH